MGGKNSGRLNRTDQLLRDMKPKPVVFNPQVTGNFNIPNLSGVKTTDDKIKVKGYTDGSILFSENGVITEDAGYLHWNNEDDCLDINIDGSQTKTTLRCNGLSQWGNIAAYSERLDLKLSRNKVILDTGNDMEFRVNNIAKMNLTTTSNTMSQDLTVDGRVTEDGTFAEIYVADGSTAQSIPTGATYTKLTGFTTDGQSSNCTADAFNDKITITKTGRYLVNCSISASSGTASSEFKFAAFLNGTEQNQIHSEREFSTANDIGSMSLSGIIDVTTANWDLDIRARHDNGGSVNLTPTYMNLTISYLGET